MELNFIKDNNKYVSEFEVSSDFNLHIERAEGGTLYIQQRTGNGQYDTVKDAVFKLGDSVIDYDFQALVYPKFIKIVSDINPIAYVTSDGEVTEIKSQTKEVEITANGTTQVAPDAGFSYLTGVTVKTNVPQSGGSGEGDLWKYAKVDNNTFLNTEILIGFAHLVRIEPQKGIGIVTSLYAYIGFSGSDKHITAIAINLTVPVTVHGTTRFMSIKDFLSSQNMTFGDMCKQLNITEITKEEFYNLES